MDCDICKKLPFKSSFLSDIFKINICPFHCYICYSYISCGYHNDFWSQLVDCSCLLLCKSCSNSLDNISSKYKFIKLREYHI